MWGLGSVAQGASATPDNTVQSSTLKKQEPIPRAVHHRRKGRGQGFLGGLRGGVHWAIGVGIWGGGVTEVARKHPTSSLARHRTPGPRRKDRPGAWQAVALPDGMGGGVRGVRLRLPLRREEELGARTLIWGGGGMVVQHLVPTPTHPCFALWPRHQLAALP